MKNQFNINKLIENKLSNTSHSKQDIQNIVDSYTRDNISDKEMTEWLKAVCLNGMNLKETVNYTTAMINSGKTVNPVTKVCE